MQSSFLFLCLLIFPISLIAQFPPGAGQPGSTAIAADSSRFIAWATQCEIERASVNISNSEAVLASLGTVENAIGPAGEGGVISLGDGGSATLTFEYPIRNGEGWDFAVFENGFPSGDGYFLELAFVEVSSDGAQFFRFPSTSLTDTSTQIDNFSVLDPTKINNLAGKYEVLYGTPFDLEELADLPNLDINQITHVRLIDVVGSLENAYARYDIDGNKINDPWPTPFESCGFDLDAVGVIHDTRIVSTQAVTMNEKPKIFPNPLHPGQKIHASIFNFDEIKLYDTLGKEWLKTERFPIETDHLMPGIYYLFLKSDAYLGTQKIMITN